MHGTQDYVKKTETTANEVEQQLQQSEKRRCGAEEELKLIAGDCIYDEKERDLTQAAGEVILMRTRAAESAGDADLRHCSKLCPPYFTFCSGTGDTNTSICD
jgi:hypothetical protein